MSPYGRRPPGSASGSAPRPPVVVTFDCDGGLLDVVGDLDWFVSDGSTREDVYQRLHDLRSGDIGAPRLVQAVELSDNRFADVHVVEEEDSYHFVLLDASAVMQALRRNQQSSHEIDLQQARLRRTLDTRGDATREMPVRSPFRRGIELFAAMIEEMRAPLTLLAGHAQVLAQRHRDDPDALRSIAAIQHAAMQLEVAAANGLIGLGELATAPAENGVVALEQLAGMLEQSFGLQARARGLGFQVRLSRRVAQIEIDEDALRQLLINLVVHALDITDTGTLLIDLNPGTTALEIELSCDPDGFDTEGFGALVTTTELLKSHAGGSFALAVSQQLLQRLHADVELVPRQIRGCDLWIRAPLPLADTVTRPLRIRDQGGSRR